ncbi:MAG: ABC transporter ATP-binding protein [Gemmatimonadota bacterium]
MIEVRDLRKEYGDLVAVDGVSLTAEPGAIFGLLGPNGAGKTTTIGCVSGLLDPTAGSVRVRGHDVVREGRAARQSLGVVPQELALYEDLSARENLAYWGAAYGLRGRDLDRRVLEVLEWLGLVGRAKVNFGYGAAVAIPHVSALAVGALVLGWIGVRTFRYQ